MTSRDFCYWLQGFFELGDWKSGDPISDTQVHAIKNHLAMVFKHEIDPSAGSKPMQDALNKIHSGEPDVRYRC